MYNQCGITLERLQSVSPHVVSVNSSKSRQAIVATELTDIAPVAAEIDYEAEDES